MDYQQEYPKLTGGPQQANNNENPSTLSPQGVSTKGTTQSREDSPNSISQQYSSITTHNRTSTNQSKPTNNSNSNNNNNSNHNDNNKVKGINNTIKHYAQSVRDKIGARTNNIKRTKTTTTTVETEETIKFSKAETGTGTTIGCVRKTSCKKHPERKEIRKKKKQKKETDRIIDRIVMAIDWGTEFEGGKEKLGTSTTVVSNMDESSVAEAREL